MYEDPADRQDVRITQGRIEPGDDAPDDEGVDQEEERRVGNHQPEPAQPGDASEDGTEVARQIGALARRRAGEALVEIGEADEGDQPRAAPAARLSVAVALPGPPQGDRSSVGFRQRGSRILLARRARCVSVRIGRVRAGGLVCAGRSGAARRAGRAARGSAGQTRRPDEVGEGRVEGRQLDAERSQKGRGSTRSSCCRTSNIARVIGGFGSSTSSTPTPNRASRRGRERIRGVFCQWRPARSTRLRWERHSGPPASRTRFWPALVALPAGPRARRASLGARRGRRSVAGAFDRGRRDGRFAPGPDAGARPRRDRLLRSPSEPGAPSSRPGPRAASPRHAPSTRDRHCPNRGASRGSRGRRSARPRRGRRRGRGHGRCSRGRRRNAYRASP